MKRKMPITRKSVGRPSSSQPKKLMSSKIKLRPSTRRCLCAMSSKREMLKLNSKNADLSKIKLLRMDGLKMTKSRWRSMTAACRIGWRKCTKGSRILQKLSRTNFTKQR